MPTYWVTVFCAFGPLLPFLFSDGSASFVADQVADRLSTSRVAVAFAGYMATAAYAFGALFAGDLVRRFPRIKGLMRDWYRVPSAGKAKTWVI